MLHKDRLDDMFGLFIAYIDRRTGGAFSDGNFVDALKDVDLNAALAQITGLGVDRLYQHWRHEVEKEFGGGLQNLSCRGSA